MNYRVFISHVDADNEIAAEFNRLLASGLDIVGSSVFCSSLPGRTIPGGFNFVEHIKTALNESKIVILLLSEQYFTSQFCLAEVGACWIQEKNVIPIIIPPVTYSKLKATLSIKQSWKINDEDSLNSIADDICNALDHNLSHAQWGVESKNFLKKIEPLLQNQKPVNIIDPEEYKKLEKELDYSISEIDKLQNKIAVKDKLIEDLKSLKDDEEVKRIEFESLTGFEQFEELCKKAKEKISKLYPNVVRDAIYYHYKGDSLPEPNAYEKDKWEEIQGAIDLNLLIKYSDEPVKLNNDHPKIKKIIYALDDLNYFMASNFDKFSPIIEDKYEITFSISDKDFWDKFIG